jgi:hypothetical protein
VISTRDARLIVDGNEIGIEVAKCVGRACNQACWTVYVKLRASSARVHHVVIHGNFRLAGDTRERINSNFDSRTDFVVCARCGSYFSLATRIEI